MLVEVLSIMLGVTFGMVLSGIILWWFLSTTLGVKIMIGVTAKMTKNMMAEFEKSLLIEENDD